MNCYEIPLVLNILKKPTNNNFSDISGTTGWISFKAVFWSKRKTSSGFGTYHVEEMRNS